MKGFGRLIVIGALLGGAAYIYQYISLITKLVYKVGNFNLKYFSLSNTQVDADLVIENKNWFTAKIYKAEVDLYIDNKFMGKLVKNEKFVLKPASITTIPVLLTIDPKTLGGNVADIFGNIDFSSETDNLGQLNVKFVGKLTTKVYGLSVNIPFSYEDIINNLK